MARNAHRLNKPTEWDPIYSFDNPRIHKTAANELLANDLGESNTFPLPRYAGDIHKVIEHIHGILTKQMQRVLGVTRKSMGHTFYRVQLEQLFWRIKADSVQRDVRSLKATLDKISLPPSRGGTGGDWAPAGYN